MPSWNLLLLLPVPFFLFFKLYGKRCWELAWVNTFAPRPESLPSEDAGSSKEETSAFSLARRLHSSSSLNSFGSWAKTPREMRFSDVGPSDIGDPDKCPLAVFCTLPPPPPLRSGGLSVMQTSVSEPFPGLSWVSSVDKLIGVSLRMRSAVALVGVTPIFSKYLDTNSDSMVLKVCSLLTSSPLMSDRKGITQVVSTFWF